MSQYQCRCKRNKKIVGNPFVILHCFIDIWTIFSVLLFSYQPWMTISLSLSIKYIYIYINYRTKLSIMENRLLRELSQIFNNFEYETNFNFYCARYCTFKKTQCIHTFNDFFSISFINWTQNTDKIFRVFKETYSVFFTIFSLYGREACHCAFMTL